MDPSSISPDSVVTGLTGALGALGATVALWLARALRQRLQLESKARTTSELETLELMREIAEQQNRIYDEVCGQTKPWIIEQDADGRARIRRRPPRGGGGGGRRDGE